MTTKPHSRNKKVVEGTVKVEKKEINKPDSFSSIIKSILGAFIKK